VELPVPGGLLQAVRSRYRRVVTRNLELGPRERALIAQKQRVSLARTIAALERCPEHAALRSVACALSVGCGNEAYNATLFRHFAETLAFDEARARHDEADDAAVSQRQNRLVQAAVFPYLEKICVLSNATLQHDNDAMLRALASRKAGVTVQLLASDPFLIAVEVDDALNKQTVFIGSCPSADTGDEIGSGSGSGGDLDVALLAPDAPVFSVDSAQLERQPGTILHLEWMNAAQRIVDALMDETPVHRSRGTVVVGHGVAGAVATAVGIILQAASFSLRNVVTFGAPKVVEEIEAKHVATLNSLRIVRGGDPRVALPASGSEGAMFQHVGELLVVSSAVADEQFPARADRQQQRAATSRRHDHQQETESVQVDAAAALFDELEGRPSVARKQHATSRPVVSASGTSHRAAEIARAFSPLAYRVALADTDAELEYFESDAGVWDEKDIQAAFPTAEDEQRERSEEINRPT
jgi:hypothetical protein